MTKEQIQERITQLERERDQAKLAIMAYEGAIQDCGYWLDQLTPPPAPKPEESKKGK